VKTPTIHGEALTVIPSVVAVDEELEVVVFILNRADLVIFVDEISVCDS
jgi:hypothetical protein